MIMMMIIIIIIIIINNNNNNNFISVSSMYLAAITNWGPTIYLLQF